MKSVKAPEPYAHIPLIKVFLAGSIEMGKAEDWQTRLTAMLEGLDLCILNPRRDDWDTSWEQKITNPQFNEQVTWELQALEDADVIVMYFDPNTKSPISLLELGLFKHKPMVVLCPEGFWRKGNVDIVCERYNIAVANDLQEVAASVMGLLKDVKNGLQLRVGLPPLGPGVGTDSPPGGLVE